MSAMLNLHPLKHCLYCDKPLKGRIDKKFCNEFCRNTYNNLQKSVLTNYQRNVIHQLRKNRLVLENVLKDQLIVNIQRQQLLSLGFHFAYRTHHYTNKLGKTYMYCFEYGYMSLDEENFLIVKNHKLTI